MARTRPDTWPLMRRLLRDYTRPHLWRLLLAMLTMGVASAMTAAQAKLLEPIINDIFVSREADRLWPIAMMVVAVFLARGVATYIHTVQTNFVGQRVVATIQHQLFRHLLRADLAFFHSRGSGQLISSLVNDVNVMRYAVVESLTTSVKSTLTLVFLVALMFATDWVLATATFIVFPAGGLFVASRGKRQRRYSNQSQEELGVFSSLLGQVFQGARHVKAYGAEAFEERRVGDVIERMFRIAHKSVRLTAASSPVMETLSGLAIVVLILYGGSRVLAGTSTPGDLIAFIGAFLLAYEPLKRMAKVTAQLNAGLAGASRIFALLDSAPSIVDRPGAKPLVIREAGIRLRDVDFAYDPQKPALRGVSLEVPAGRTVALVGPSGAGKSTILNLIPRFYDVEGGAVLIDGQDVREVTLDSLRGAIALVSQEVSLFDDTIRANIAYGQAGATQEAVERAAVAAAAHDFITGLPQGYDTMVGEHGVKLSGGQRQRIAIARAMLRDAPILLLDEATSALDTESERAVQEALNRLRAGRTTLVIAHRLSTIVDADIICAMEAGRVVESGSHAELLARGGLYARLYGQQAETERGDHRAAI